MSITIRRPFDYEREWNVGDPAKVVFEKPGNNITEVDIDISYNGGSSWSTIVSNYTIPTDSNGNLLYENTYVWGSGPSVPSASGVVRVTVSDSSVPGDIGDSVTSNIFLIGSVSPIDFTEYVELTNFNGGETITGGYTYTINWTYDDGGSPS